MARILQFQHSTATVEECSAVRNEPSVSCHRGAEPLVRRSTRPMPRDWSVVQVSVLTALIRNRQVTPLAAETHAPVDRRATEAELCPYRHSDLSKPTRGSMNPDWKTRARTHSVIENG